MEVPIFQLHQYTEENRAQPIFALTNTKQQGHHLKSASLPERCPSHSLILLVLYQLKSCMSKPSPGPSLQEMLDEALKIHGQICYLDQEIERHEENVIGTGWLEGNIKIGWIKNNAFSEKNHINLLNRDRIFSLSSITSHASLHQNPIENERTTPIDGARFYKKKKNGKKKKGSQRDSKFVLRKIKRGRGRPPKKAYY